MTKTKKIVLAILVLLTTLFVALIILASVLITPERVRDTVLPLAEDALDRKVELGGIEVSLFSGISLQAVAVQKKIGQGTFISVEKVVLRYSLLALLMLKVEVDEITLVRPRIEIVRNRDGSFNYSDLTAEEKAGGDTDGKAASTGGGGIDLHVSSINISDGQLLFVDNAAHKQAERHEVRSFNLQANDVSLVKMFPFKLGADWNGNSIGISGQIDLSGPAADLDTRFNKINLHISGGLDNDKPVATLRLPQISFADLLGSVPKEYAADLDGLKLKGTVEVSVDLKDDVVTTKGFVVDINGQRVKLDLKAANIYDKVVKVDFNVESDSLLIDKLLPSSVDGSDSGGSGRTVTAAKEVGPFSIPLDLTGKVALGKAEYNGVPVTNLILKLSLLKNIFRIESLQADIAGGKFTQRGKVDLGVKGFQYSSDLDLKGIRSPEMVKLVKPELAGSVQGILGGEMQISGAGTLLGTVKKNLSGQGTMRLVDGKLLNIPSLNSIAALLDLSELKEIDLNDGNVNFKIDDGQVSIDSRVSGPTTRIMTSGQVSLNGKLNLRSQLALSPELGGRLHEKGKLARYLGDEKGWTTVPVQIKGDYASPDVGLDSKGLKKQAEKAVKKEVQKSVEKELQRGLNKLFGN